MKHRHLNAWNVYIKRRSIEIFDRENDFTDINEFKEYINVHKPFDKMRRHRKKTIKNENTYYIDPETKAQKKVETFEHFRLMVLQDWNDMTDDDKAVYRSIAIDMNKKSKEEVDRQFKADLLVLQYQIKQLQKGIDAMISSQ